MKHAIIGIDPGLNGGITILSESHELIECCTIPTLKATTKTDKEIDIHKLSGLLSDWTQVMNLIVYVEEPIAMPLLSNQSLATTFRNFGILWAIINLKLLIPKKVRPNEWSKEIIGKQEKIPYAERKKRNAKIAKNLFPEWNPTSMGQLYAESDSLLIAEYGYRKEYSDAIKYIDKEIAKAIVGTTPKVKRSKSSNVFLE